VQEFQVAAEVERGVIRAREIVELRMRQSSSRIDSNLAKESTAMEEPVEEREMARSFPVPESAGGDEDAGEGTGKRFEL
jgi:hypothetical protein